MRSVPRFSTECDCDAEPSKTAEPNQILETEEHPQVGKPPSARQLASALIDNALKRHA
jgi:hypothetical protein